MENYVSGSPIDKSLENQFSLELIDKQKDKRLKNSVVFFLFIFLLIFPLLQTKPGSKD